MGHLKSSSSICCFENWPWLGSCVTKGKHGSNISKRYIWVWCRCEKQLWISKRYVSKRDTSVIYQSDIFLKARFKYDISRRYVSQSEIQIEYIKAIYFSKRYITVIYQSGVFLKARYKWNISKRYIFQSDIQWYYIKRGTF